MTPRSEMEAALEAILFASSEPIARERLLDVFSAEEKTEAESALAAVLARYPADEGRGVMVDEVAGGIRLVTRPELAGWLRRFFDIRGGSKLSMAALETLAIIAYRQPITGPEIQELRGVSPSGVLKTLLERRLVKIAGKKAVVGNPFLYRTTREFLVHFGLASIKDLPPLEEFEETFGMSGEGGAAHSGAEVLSRLEESALAADEAAEEPRVVIDPEEAFEREAIALEEARDDGERAAEAEDVEVEAP